MTRPTAPSWAGSANDVDAPSAPPTRPSERQWWWVAFGAVLVPILLWSLALPLLGSPDEPSHVVTAAAVSRGQLLGRTETVDGNLLTHVRVPAGYPDRRKPCFARSSLPASCQHLHADSRTVDATTLSGRYPPLYYALVGPGSYLSPGPTGMRAMRALSAVLSAALLASALASAQRWRSGLGIAGVAVACTPMALFLAGSVNPNGLEVSAAICAWASALALVESGGAAPRRLVVRTAVAFATLALVRGLSPLLLALLGAVVLCCASWTALRALARRRDVQLAGGGVGLAAAAAVAYIVGAGSLTLAPVHAFPGLTFSAALSHSFKATPVRLEQMIGVLGWLDAPSPPMTYLLWYFALGALLLLGLATASWRLRVVLVGAGVMTVAVPAVLEASQAAQLGYVWQGRYTLAFAVGVPLVAAWATRLVPTVLAGSPAVGPDAPPAPVASSGLLSTALSRWTVVTCLLGQLLAFVYVLRRHTVGLDRPLVDLLHPAWRPPLPPVALVVAFTVALAVLLVLLVRDTRDAGEAGDEAPRHRSRARVPQPLVDVLARGAGVVSRLIGRGSGTVLPGRLAMALDEGVLERLARGRELVMVSGTNGKTTTTRLVVAALSARGPVVSNATGSNLESGLVTTLLGPDRTATAVLEVDEVVLARVIHRAAPKVLVLLNLSRDQLDRTFEVSQHVQRWAGVLSASDAVVVANADDPSVVSAVRQARPQEQRVVWVGAGQRWRADGALCPRCGAPWDLRATPWSCSTCGDSRPLPSLSVVDDTLVTPSGESLQLGLGLPGRANAGNAAMAVAAAGVLGVPAAQAVELIRPVRDVAGRYQHVLRDGRDLRLLLAKNPAGWFEALQEVVPDDVALLLAVNARAADGTDPSWLWDVDFERLAGRPVVVTGERGTDLAVRLAYAGVEHELCPSLPQALNALPSGRCDVLANYTAFADIRAFLARERQGGAQGGGAA